MAVRSSQPNAALTMSRIDAVPTPRFPRRFRARVFLYMVALSLGTSVASSALYYWRQLGFIERNQTMRAGTLLTGLATQSELCAYAGDPALCELALRRTLGEEDVVFAAIYDKQGHEILGYARAGVLPPAPPDFVFRRLSEGVDALPPTFTGNHGKNDPWDDLYSPIVTAARDAAAAMAAGAGGPAPEREIVGVARVGLSLHLARDQLVETVRWGGLLGLGTLAVGILAAFLVSRRVSRPIGALIRGADQIRLGDLETRVKVETRDELGQLAYSFNRMARRLNESITALETLNSDLEVEVARRTVEVQRAADFSALLNAPLGAPEQGPPPRAGAEADGTLATLLDEALIALMNGTEAYGGAVMLTPEQADSTFDAGTMFLARHQGLNPEDFGEAPPDEFLEPNLPFKDGNRTIAPLLLGNVILGYVVLVDMPGRADLMRFLGQAASQLAIAVGNVRAYAAADRLARALKERNAALAKQRDQLQEMNRLKSEFLANISHELRTPLNAIIGYCELISDGIYGDVNGEQITALAGIDESGKGLLQLINQILDLAKVEAGKMTVHLEEIDIVDVARSVAQEAAGLTKDRPYKVTLSAGGPKRVRTDGPKIKQILTNLVSNAVKFTLKGRVEMRVRAEADGGCTIAVQDTGIGIKPADMKIIFEEFRQADGSYTREFGGTGLGLAIARRFAVMLGGSIAVESEPGVGSTFTLRLPREAAMPKQPPSRFGTPPSAPRVAAPKTPSALASASVRGAERPRR